MWIRSFCVRWLVVAMKPSSSIALPNARPLSRSATLPAAIRIMPKANEKDLRDIPEEIRKQIKLVLVENMDQVLEAALRRKPAPLTEGPGKSTGGGKEKESESGSETRVRPGFPQPADQPPAIA